MVRTCAHGLCNSNDRYAGEPHMDNVRFLAFPKPRTQPDKCRRWVKACNRVGFTVASVTKSTFICTKHFHGGCGPTVEHPDPIMAHISQYGHITNKTKKRLLITSDCDETQSNTSETWPETLIIGSQLDVKQQALSEGESSLNEYFITPDTDNEVSQPNPNFLGSSVATESRSTENDFENSDSTDIDSENDTMETVTSSQPLHTKQDPKTEPLSNTNSENEDKPAKPGPTTFQTPDVKSLSQQQAFIENTPCTVEFVNESLKHQKETLKKMYNEIISLDIPRSWACYYDYTDLILVKFQKDNPVITLKSNLQLKIHLTIRLEELGETHPLRTKMSAQQITSVRDLLNVLSILDSWKVCDGIKDKVTIDESLNANLRPDCKIMSKDLTLHSKQCELIFPAQGVKTTCLECKTVKRRMACVAYRKRHQPLTEDRKSNCNTRYLPMKEIQRRQRESRAKLKAYSMKIRRLQQRLGLKIDDCDFDLGFEEDEGNDLLDEELMPTEDFCEVIIS